MCPVSRSDVTIDITVTVNITDWVKLHGAPNLGPDDADLDARLARGVEREAGLVIPALIRSRFGVEADTR
jgi:hypothetical protein